MSCFRCVARRGASSASRMPIACGPSSRNAVSRSRTHHPGRPGLCSRRTEQSMKTVELRRHTASDGDRLTPDGIAAAVEIGSRLEAPYDLLISSGAQRATQTLASFLAGSGQRSPGGVTVDESFRSALEERWVTAARASED